MKAALRQRMHSVSKLKTNLLLRFRRRLTLNSAEGENIPTLDERIEYMLSASIPFDPCKFEISAIRDAVAAIERGGYAIRVDDYHDQKESESIGRLGSAVFSDKHSPLIYLILGLNSDDLELADTIFHEALHCTAQSLGRHITLPEGEATGEVWLEELCVYSGLCHLYPKLHIPEMRELHRRNKDRHQRLKDSLKTGLPVEVVENWDRHGVDAAHHLHQMIAEYR